MAEIKPKKTIENFADELDSMLTVDEMASQSALIDDDEALERLLVGNVDDGADHEQDDLLEIDALIASVPETDSMMANIDEFAEDLQEIIDEVVEVENQQSTEVAEPPALTIEPELDELVLEEELISADNALSNDALADDERYASADFDISTDEEGDELTQAVGGIDTGRMAEPELLTEFSADEANLDDARLPEFAAVENKVSEAPAELTNNPIMIDHSQELVALNNQIKELKKQNLHFKQSLEQAIEQKADKEIVSSCLDSIESLQTGQKKVSRNLDAVSNRKPVAAWVASGIAVVALGIGVGMGLQGVIAKSQVGELLAMVQKVQEQTESAPAANAADQAMLQKQLDELVAANGAITQQLQDLSKNVEGGDGAANLPADASKQLTDLANQIMQMGAAVESIQNRLAALEKGKLAATASAAKPVAAKKQVSDENWAVNLVAFKQDWYAQRKAQEFAEKGIAAHVVQSESKGEIWHRLTVDGFKTQYEAAAYAARVKKTLNLDSVWVSKN